MKSFRKKLEDVPYMSKLGMEIFSKEIEKIDRYEKLSRLRKYKYECVREFKTRWDIGFILLMTSAFVYPPGIFLSPFIFFSGIKYLRAEKFCLKEIKKIERFQ